MRFTKPDRDKIEAVYKELTINFFDRMYIDDLCAAHKISQTKLANGFREMYGITIYKYQLERCMEYAKYRLVAGTKISELVTKLGYSSHQIFSHAFKKIYSEGPSIYKFSKRRLKVKK